MLKIKNEELVNVITFLEGFELQPKVSRVRTRLVKLIREKIDELYKDEVELLERFGKKDEEGNLIQDNGNFSLLPETAAEYHKEKAVLLDEDSVIDMAELHDKLPLLIGGLEDSEVKVSGKDLGSIGNRSESRLGAILDAFFNTEMEEQKNETDLELDSDRLCRIRRTRWLVFGRCRSIALYLACFCGGRLHHRRLTCSKREEGLKPYRGEGDHEESVDFLVGRSWSHVGCAVGDGKCAA